LYKQALDASNGKEHNIYLATILQQRLGKLNKFKSKTLRQPRQTINNVLSFVIVPDGEVVPHEDTLKAHTCTRLSRVTKVS